MNPQDLIEIAEYLVSSRRGKPKQAFLRRSISALYYAVFHSLAQNCADSLIGGKSADRSDPAWQQVYRSLEHGFVKNQCKDGRIARFPKQIQDFANFFSGLQVKRHQADYDPFERFAKSAVLLDIEQAKAVINEFRSAPLKDKRAFAAFVLFKTR